MRRARPLAYPETGHEGCNGKHHQGESLDDTDIRCDEWLRVRRENDRRYRIARMRVEADQRDMGQLFRLATELHRRRKNAKVHEG